MSFLEDFQTDLELLPALLHRTYGTLRNLDNSLQALLQQNEQRCIQDILDLKQEIESGNVKPDKSCVKFSDEALEEQKHCLRIADEKVTLASQAYDVVDGQIQKLDQFMRKLDELKQVKESGTAAAGTSSPNIESSTRSGRGTENSRRKKTRLAVETPSVNLDLPVDPNEPTYCFCNQVSYGEMVACDNPQCTIEWFHFGCVGLKEQPKGKWYCSNCVGTQKHRKGK